MLNLNNKIFQSQTHMRCYYEERFPPTDFARVESFNISELPGGERESERESPSGALTISGLLKWPLGRS